MNIFAFAWLFIGGGIFSGANEAVGGLWNSANSIDWNW